MNKDIVNLAYVIADNDESKAKAILDLVNLLTYKGSKMPDVKMVLADESCGWCENGECWLNMPDSKLRCTGTCESYWAKETESVKDKGDIFDEYFDVN